MVVKKRIHGPEKSIPLDQPLQPKRTRKIDQLRPVFVSTKLNNSPGSCYYEASNLKDKLIRNGPKQSKETAINCYFKFASFSSKERRSYQYDDQEKEYSRLVKNALMPAIQTQKLELMQLDIHILVLEADGDNACLAAGITCASIALADAGIEMYDLVTGCSAGLVGKQLRLDLTEQEQSQADALFLVASMCNLNEITLVIEEGVVTSELCLKGIDLCVDASLQLSQVLANTLIK